MQMMPLSWVTLMLFFITLFLSINIFLYYNKNSKMTQSNSMKYSIKNFWKW